NAGLSTHLRAPDGADPSRPTLRHPAPGLHHGESRSTYGSVAPVRCHSVWARGSGRVCTPTRLRRSGGPGDTTEVPPQVPGAAAALPAVCRDEAAEPWRAQAYGRAIGDRGIGFVAETDEFPRFMRRRQVVHANA